MQVDGKVVPGNGLAFLYSGIDEYEGFAIDVIDDEVQVAVIVQVCVGGSIGHGRLIDAGLGGCIRKCVIPVIEV